MVYLVGAGPGDQGLITVRGLDLIRRADVILYDRLAAPSLLFEARPSCELVDVGKSTGSHTKPQDETTELLIEYGRRGVDVVRLKGGDPFLFGRGGEEAERLAREGIPFEIVPGVSALTGVTAYAGIPLTHRDFASSVGIATGHAADGKHEDQVRWEELAHAADTIVVFMGIGALAGIVGRLISGGKKPDTPAALIERGATQSQRVVTGTLADICDLADRERISPPALFIAGDTVPLARTIGWYRPGPLASLTVGITRPRDRSRSFMEKLAGLGAEPMLMPTIMTEDMTGSPGIKKAIGRLELYDTIVYISANGVDSFFRALASHKLDSRALSGKTIAAIGPATAGALNGHGITPEVVAATFIAEGLLEKLRLTANIRGVRFLLVRSDIGRDTLAKGLHDAGAVVDQAAFYTTRTVPLSNFARTSIIRGGIHIVTFTSSSTVKGFFESIRPDELPKDIVLASIGPETTRALVSHGVSPAIEARAYTVEGLVEAILEWRAHTPLNPVRP